jgi:trehalose synthase
LVHPSLDQYRSTSGTEALDQLLKIAEYLKGASIVHINSTREGGGVAEILSRMLPLSQLLGLNFRWEVIEGEKPFFQCTKKFHNLLQGQQVDEPTSFMIKNYEYTNEENAKRLKHILQEADIVFIHDPQPLSLISHFPDRKGKWFWRCHIDLSEPSKTIWDYLKQFIDQYDASIFSLEKYSHPLDHPIYFIAPSIDPLSEKNIEMEYEQINEILDQLHIDIHRPYLLQVSRFDRLKDPIGVIDCFKWAKTIYPELQLVLAGSQAKDDPEGLEYFKEIALAANGIADVYLLDLPAKSFKAINCLQRGATLILQKSIKEGFGLTVTEALWKEKPVIGGNTGGIRLQIEDHQTGFLVDTPFEAFERIHFFLQNPQTAKELGRNGKEHVRKHFLITRHLREYLTVMAKHLFPEIDFANLVPIVNCSINK